MQLHIWADHQDEIYRVLETAERGPSSRLLKDSLTQAPTYRLDIETGVNGQMRPVREEGKTNPPLPDLVYIKTAWGLWADYRPWSAGCSLRVYARWDIGNPYFLVFDVADSSKDRNVGGPVNNNASMPFTTHSILEVLLGSTETLYARLAGGVNEKVEWALQMDAVKGDYYFDPIFDSSGAPNLKNLHYLGPHVADFWFGAAVSCLQRMKAEVARTVQANCEIDSLELSRITQQLAQKSSLGLLFQSLGI